MDDNSKDQHGERPLARWELEAQALREKTERLKALRLARDGADKPAASSSTPKRSSAKTPARSKPGKSTATLADWLKTQEDQGRRR